MTRPSDWQQRQQARDPERSCIVQAPAGSGKTELLTQRMLALLARVENPEEVVAITFTRKAAAEMNHRLVQRLRDAAQAPAAPAAAAEPLAEHEQISRDLALRVLENDRLRDWHLLEQSSRLRIRTIDSLCSELARQLPLLSGLGGGQQIAPDAEALYRAAAIRAMAAIEDAGDELQADVVRLLDRYDNQYDRLVGLLTAMLGNREQWLGHLLAARVGDGFDRSGLERALLILVESQLREALENTPQQLFENLPAILHYALGNDPDDAEQLTALLAATESPDGARLLFGDSADMLPHWCTLIRRLVTRDGKKFRSDADVNAGFPPPSKANGAEKAERTHWKAAMKGLLVGLADDDPLREIYNSVLSLPRPGYEGEAWESLESMMRLLLRAAGEWKFVLAESGQADFSEIAARAIESLGPAEAPSDLALRMDYRISHLLVDEFQDTSNSQIRLLERLTEGWSEGDGRTLFLVGDPMQSIYRFRKAEVSLFIEAWNGRLLPHIPLDRLRLQVNFRSNRPIVEWANRVFPQIMPRRSEPVMGAVPYSPADCRPGVSDDGSVTIEILPERDEAEEARRVLEVIRGCGENEKVAILVRSRPAAGGILAALDRAREADARFRYRAVDFNPLATAPMIQDLVSLTLALLQPADRLAWLAILRAPFIGLDLADLDALVAGDTHGIILDAIAAAGGLAEKPVPAGLSEPGVRRLRRVAPVLERALQRRGREPVRTLVEDTWLQLGGPACLDNRSELEDAATYFRLVDSLEAENVPIDHDSLEQRMDKLFAEPDADADGNLLVMTIYAAKGLQFDHVIVPGLNRKPSGDTGKLLHWFELPGDDGIVMSPMRNQAEKEQKKTSGDLISFISNVEKKRSALEDGRLLYVAATRAVKSLWLFGAIKPNRNGEVNPGAASLMACLWPAIGAGQAPLIREAASLLEYREMTVPEPDNGEAAEEAGAALDLPRVYRRLSADWQLPAPPSSVPLARAEAPETRDYIEFSWAGEDARLVGNLVHRLLQLVADRGPEHWRATGGMPAREDWCRQELGREGVDRARAGRLIEDAARAVGNCLDSERGRWILHPHEAARSEYAVTAVLDGQPVNLKLDRTFVDDGIRWVIDYKTSTHAGGDLDGFLASEMDRYRDQLERYRRAMALSSTQPVRTALYFPLLDRFCVSE
jgi:ATP-dependent exoDNAse (exonuclease V) beta subunit